jgi:diguanylate cyclase (GGDEF)-like protein
LTDLMQTPQLAILATFLAGVMLLIVFGLLVALYQASAARQKAEIAAREIKEASVRKFRRLEHDLNFLVDFYRVFARLLAEMHAEKKVRMIPQALLNAMVEIYGPEVAVVLVRRGPSGGNPEEAPRLSVVALHSTRGSLHKGMEFRFGEGQAGMVAERMQVMVRKDFEEDQLASYERSRIVNEPKYDIIAPMVAGEETLGVLAISRPDRHHDSEREVLEMIARVGALTWKNVQAYRDKEAEAEIDKLTQIFNKGALLHRLGMVLLEARTTGDKASVFMFDLDNFKVYNDTNGHLAGDRLLTQLSQLVKETVRSDDVFGRFGGEEFLLVMPNRNGTQAMTVARAIRKRIEEHPFVGGETQPLGCVTISGGVACFPDDAAEQVELMKAADDALYRAKEGGRNEVRRADESGLNPIVSR